MLNEVSGSSGVAQRGMKQDYKAAERAPTQFGMADGSSLNYGYAPNKPSAGGLAAGGRGGMGGGMGGMGMMPGMSGGAPRIEAEARSSLARAKDRSSERLSQVEAAAPVAGPQAGETVRQLGNKTFFRKGKRWVDSSVKPDEESKAVVVRQFSAEFFKLAREQKSELNQYLTFDEPVTLKLDGQVYRIEPAS
jgi:Ca-activated chloride channel family protein